MPAARTLGMSSAADIAELWGDVDTDSGGEGETDADMTMGRHDFEISQQRLHNIGFQQV